MDYKRYQKKLKRLGLDQTDKSQEELASLHQAIKSAFTGLQPIPGPQGEKGEQGIQGVKGEKGLKGEKGDKGDAGIQGIKGVKGDKGEIGPKGEKGKDGRDGKDGKDGKTIYKQIGKDEALDVVEGLEALPSKDKLDPVKGLKNFTQAVRKVQNNFPIGGSGGSQDAVENPGTSTDNAIARFDGTTGKLIQDSAVTIDDSGFINVPVQGFKMTDGTNQWIVTINTNGSLVTELAPPAGLPIGQAAVGSTFIVA